MHLELSAHAEINAFQLSDCCTGQLGAFRRLAYTEAWMHLTLQSLRWRDDDSFAYHHDPAFGDVLRAHGPMRDIELWPWWGHNECPVLALRGCDSEILLTETTAETRQDGVEVIEYSGIGHTPSLMVAEQIASVTDWLRA